ncbi:ariadne ring [Lecanosticta acicola]|uniref:Ariadne ring n=1 Tax=Lecanosticta acicola TaxID=111012 RepID=A0AAI9E7F9_9PEZI|nr:ariadne ring [Lecanosticta acicola]
MRRRPCIFFQKGSCRNGENCHFAHAILASQPPANPSAASTESPAPDLRSLATCMFFLRGTCAKGGECPYDHPTTAEPGQPQPDSDDDNFRRVIHGALVQFEDGGAVSDVSIPSELSTARVQGLSSTSSTNSICTLLSGLDFDIPQSAVRLGLQSDTASANITVEDKSFARRLCKAIKSSDLPEHARLTVAVVPPQLPNWVTARTSSCEKAVVQWPNRMQMVELHYEEDSYDAFRVFTAFETGAYKIRDQSVKADFRVSANMVVLEDVPYGITEDDVKNAILASHDLPESIHMSEADQEEDIPAVPALIESLLSGIGPLNFTVVSSPYRKRGKAIARFFDETDAWKAVSKLHGRKCDFIDGRRLSLRLVASFKSRLPMAVYEAIEDQLAALVPLWTDQRLTYKVYPDPTGSKRFVTLKLEGLSMSHVAEGANAIEKMGSGRVVEADEKPFWVTTLAGDNATSARLERIAKEHGVLVICHKPKRQLQYFGPPENYRELCDAVVHSLQGEDTLTNVFNLNADQFSWACRGGFSQFAEVLGFDTLSLDVVSQPKKITFAGSRSKYGEILRLLEAEDIKLEEATLGVPESRDCAICLTPAEDPVVLPCGHHYCRSECFEGLCISTDASTTNLGVICNGDQDKCNTAVPLAMIKAHCSKFVFEDFLTSSFGGK